MDMENFNVLPPSRQLRTSDYIPEIIQFIQKLVTNGFGHELNSSIYFDTSNFQEQHLYPELGYDQTDEPIWQSPQGPSRPGPHIECSVMASTMLGSSLDIHTGDIDHKSPHHDNKIAQSEAYYNKDSCLNYFFHIDHLTINGCKIVKSSKNVVTIFNKHLKKYCARKIRLLFLLNSWSSTPDYDDRGIE